ncbi:MAG: tetratricopeptide repeat protein [Synechococcales bacterium]|nr:tetratricopeptide repeat protein [Synechococcales bacterium]
MEKFKRGFVKVIDFHSQSLEIMQTIGNRSGIAISLNSLGNAYRSLGEHAKAIDCYEQSLEIRQAIGDRWGVGASLFNLGNTLAKLDEHFNALQNYQKAKAIYEELKLDYMVEQCNTAIYTCNQTIAAQRRTPPPIIDAPPAESMIEWCDRQRQLNQPKTYTTNHNFFLWFCVGIAIVLLIAGLKH